MGKRILPFALNHMTAPGMPTDAFLDLATALGCVGVEIRSDLPAALFDAKSSEHVQKITKAIGLRILALAEVMVFNDFSDAKPDEARALMEIAVACVRRPSALFRATMARPCATASGRRSC